MAKRLPSPEKLVRNGPRSEFGYLRSYGWAGTPSYYLRLFSSNQPQIRERRE